VIHSAGVLDDGVVAQIDWTRFVKVLAPKVDGGWALHRATRDERLDFFVLYSSIAALLGSPGQSNHASANAFLDALAHYRRACGRPAASLNWGAWLETGAAAGEDVASRAAERGLLGLTPDEGLAALGRLLDPSCPQVGVMRLDWSRFLERHPAGAPRAFFASVPRKAATAAAAPRRAQDLESRLQSASPGGREALLRSEVRAVAVKVLGLQPTEAFDPRRPLQEMGLDSLMAVELRNALGAATGRALPATLLFDYPSVEALVSYLAAEVLGMRATAAGQPSDTKAAVVDAIEDLSDEDVDRLLAEKRGGRRP
jgi:acyl carrier protein